MPKKILLNALYAIIDDILKFFKKLKIYFTKVMYWTLTHVIIVISFFFLWIIICDFNRSDLLKNKLITIELRSFAWLYYYIRLLILLSVYSLHHRGHSIQKEEFLLQFNHFGSIKNVWCFYFFQQELFFDLSNLSNGERSQ